MPKVSVLTPVYNAADFIGEAIKSVAESDFQDYEHIIVDDGSTDSSRESIAEAVHSLSKEACAKVQVFYKSNSGEAETDNYALDRASGDFVVVLNADDIIGQSLLRRSIEEIEKSQSILVTYPDWTMIDKVGAQISEIRTKEFSLEELIGRFDCLPGPGACIRRSAIETSFRDSNYPLISDYEFWQRMALKGNFVRIPEFHASWRLHGQNLSTISRGADWAHQAISVAKKLAYSSDVAVNRKLKRLAALGLSRAYLLAALQGTWDERVPIGLYLRKSLILGARNGRILSLRDVVVLITAFWSLIKRKFRVKAWGFER
jgi:glycosyltransferase involved in cell wall biosynthesis